MVFPRFSRSGRSGSLCQGSICGRSLHSNQSRTSCPARSCSGWVCRTLNERNAFIFIVLVSLPQFSFFIWFPVFLIIFCFSCFLFSIIFFSPHFLLLLSSSSLIVSLIVSIRIMTGCVCVCVCVCVCRVAGGVCVCVLMRGE